MHNIPQKSNKKSTIIAIIVLAAILLVCGVCWFMFSPKSGGNKNTEQGDRTAEETGKHIVIEITHKDGTKREVEITTDADYLYDAMKQENLIGELNNGMFDTVDGETADSSNEEWWGYTKSEEYVSVGLSDCVISDGDHYEFTLHIGYDEFF